VSQFKSKRSKANERIQVWHFPGSDAAIHWVPVPGGRGAFQLWIQRAMSGWRKKQIKEYEEMAIDNSTGKDKEFYDLGKKMFDRIQPITRGVPQIPQERYPKRPWVGLTDKEILADDVLRYYFGLNGGGGPVSKSGRKIVDAIEKKLKELNQ
jgi:hypothetical protein